MCLLPGALHMHCHVPTVNWVPCSVVMVAGTSKLPPSWPPLTLLWTGMGLLQPLSLSCSPLSASGCGPPLSVAMAPPGPRNNIHCCSLLRLDLGTCTLLTLPTPGVETCRAAGPNKPASQHAPCGPYAWVSQAVHTVENQAVHADWHQQPHHPQGGVTPALVSADEHVLGGQPGT